MGRTIALLQIRGVYLLGGKYYLVWRTLFMLCASLLSPCALAEYDVSENSGKAADTLPTSAPADLLGHFSEWKADPWDVERFEKELGLQKVTTMPEAIGLLPPWLRASYTMVYESGDGEEPVNDKRPRVVFFSPDGTFQVSFNGETQSLKVAQFRSDPDRLELKEIRFPIVQPVGPQKSYCNACHQNDPDFIVDQYDRWHHWYGGNDDGIRLGSAEARDLLAFKKMAEGDPLYTNLITDLSQPYYPYHVMDPKLGKNSLGRGLSAMPNTRLTGLINRLQGRIFARRLAGSPLFEKYKFALAYVLLERDRGLAPFLDKSTGGCLQLADDKSSLQNEAQLKEEAELASAIEADYAARFPGREYLAKTSPKDWLRIDVLFELLGVKPSAMDLSKELAEPSFASKSLKNRPWEFSDGFFRMRDYIQEQLWLGLERENESLAALHETTDMNKAFELAKQHYAGEARYQREYHLTPDQREAFDMAGKAMLSPKGGKKGFAKACATTRELALESLRRFAPADALSPVNGTAPDAVTHMMDSSRPIE